MNIRRVVVAAAADRLAEQERFYRDRLSLRVVGGAGRVAVTAGRTTIEFAGAAGAPFTHFALLAPGNRFREAFAWLRERVNLLPDTDTGQPVFDFDDWDAQACYFEDPAGNIVELIAHRGVAESDIPGFDASDLRGLSEVGLVTPDRPAAATAIESVFGVPVWDGSVDGRGLAFVGRRAHTLILSPAGRNWLPTQRAAAVCATELELDLDRAGDLELDGGLIRIRS